MANYKDMVRLYKEKVEDVIEWVVKNLDELRIATITTLENLKETTYPLVIEKLKKRCGINNPTFIKHPLYGTVWRLGLIIGVDSKELREELKKLQKKYKLKFGFAKATNVAQRIMTIIAPLTPLHDFTEDVREEYTKEIWKVWDKFNDLVITSPDDVAWHYFNLNKYLKYMIPNDYPDPEFPEVLLMILFVAAGYAKIYKYGYKYDLKNIDYIVDKNPTIGGIGASAQVFLPVGPGSVPFDIWLIKTSTYFEGRCELSDKLFKWHKKIIIKEAKKVLGIDPRKPAKLKKWLEILAKDGADKLREICQKASELYEQKFIEEIAKKLNLHTRDKWEVLRAYLAWDKVSILNNGLNPVFLKRFNLKEWPYVITDPTLPHITAPRDLISENEEELINLYRDDSIRQEKYIENIVEEILCCPVGSIPTRLASKLLPFITNYAKWEAYANTIYISPRRIQLIRDNIRKSVKEILDNLGDIISKKYSEVIKKTKKQAVEIKL